jgi:7,8-didemethyl-8-hydroxy-5-deazariboflavin synthase CofG subunit
MTRATFESALARVHAGERRAPGAVVDALEIGALDFDGACRLIDADERELPMLLDAASERRDRLFGRTVTFSPKVFLPVTNLCRNRCDYCSFRKSPGDAGEWTMTPDDVLSVLDRGREQGCFEALLCLGDTPETGFGEYRTLLRTFGHERTVDYLHWIAERALERGILPHTNAGILAREDMARLRDVNVSLGLMLENVSERLCEKGMPHHKAPDKRPQKRLAMTRQAGELGIPFTSGLLIGIGETREERVQTLFAIRELAEAGHVGEIIVQNFRARPGIAMEDAPEPDADEMARTIALARLVMPDDVHVQAPPNLNADSLRLLLDAGIDDFGGISPVTPDYINPLHPWPHLERLRDGCERLGFTLRARLAAYPRHLDDPRFVAPAMRSAVAAARRRPPTYRWY